MRIIVGIFHVALTTTKVKVLPSELTSLFKASSSDWVRRITMTGGWGSIDAVLSPQIKLLNCIIMQ